MPLFLSCTITASAMTASSMSLFKYSNLLIEKRQALQALEGKKSSCNSVFCHPVWIIGFLVAILSMYFNGLALNYGTVILLSSTSVFTIIFSAIQATIFFSEKFTCRDAVSIVLLTIGSLICVS